MDNKKLYEETALREQVKEINDVLKDITSENDKIREVLLATHWGKDYYQALELFGEKDVKCPLSYMNALAYSIQQIEIPECSIMKEGGHLYIDADILLDYLERHSMRCVTKKVRTEAAYLGLLCNLMNKFIRSESLPTLDIDLSSIVGWHLYRNSDGEPALYTFNGDVYMWMNSEETELGHK